MPGQIFVAKDTQYVILGDAQLTASKGVTTAREGHPVMAKYPGLWEPLVPDFEVEDKPAAKPQEKPPEAKTAPPEGTAQKPAGPATGRKTQSGTSG